MLLLKPIDTCSTRHKHLEMIITALRNFLQRLMRQSKSRSFFSDLWHDLVLSDLEISYKVTIKEKSTNRVNFCHECNWLLLLGVKCCKGMLCLKNSISFRLIISNKKLGILPSKTTMINRGLIYFL